MEPVSHTILYGLVKAWLELICDTSNGIVIDGIPFVLTGPVLDKFNAVINGIVMCSAYNRPPLSLESKAQGCVLCKLCRVRVCQLPVIPSDDHVLLNLMSAGELR